MKDEPRLIDLYAMFALPGVIQRYMGESTEFASITAYEYATQMMKARKQFNSEGDEHESEDIF